MILKLGISELCLITTRKDSRGSRGILSLPASIIYRSPSIYVSNPIDVRTSLSMINDASEILGLLLDGGHSLKTYNKYRLLIF